MPEKELPIGCPGNMANISTPSVPPFFSRASVDLRIMIGCVPETRRFRLSQKEYQPDAWQVWIVVSGVGRENHRMMLDHYSQTKCLLVSYDPKPLGLF